jgi:hypothetical protein
MATTSKQQILLSWQAPEFRHYPKNAAWYITLCIITALLIIFQVLQKDIFGAICLFIFGIFIVIFSRQRPRLVNIQLTTTGLVIDESFIPYKTVKHFWLVNNDNHQTLNVETTAYLNRTLIIQLEGQDPEKVRDIMAQNAPEHSATEETLAQRVMHRLKF